MAKREHRKKFAHDVDCAYLGGVGGICTCGYEEDHPEEFTDSAEGSTVQRVAKSEGEDKE
jgi:hypothetical protein